MLVKRVDLLVLESSAEVLARVLVAPVETRYHVLKVVSVEMKAVLVETRYHVSKVVSAETMGALVTVTKVAKVASKSTIEHAAAAVGLEDAPRKSDLQSALCHEVYRVHVLKAVSVSHTAHLASAQEVNPASEHDGSAGVEVSDSALVV